MTLTEPWMLCFHNKPSDGCHLVREIVVSEGEVEPADQRQPQQGGHLHPVLASSAHPRNGAGDWQRYLVSCLCVG